MPKPPTPKVGDIISIQYNGEIMESYPAQLGEIYDIPSAQDHPFYGDWVRGYADPHYGEANVLLLEMTDRLTLHYTEQQVRQNG